MAGNNERRNDKIIKWLELTLDNKTMDLESTYSAMRIANNFLENAGLNARFRFGHGQPTVFDFNDDQNPIHGKGTSKSSSAKKPTSKTRSNCPFNYKVPEEKKMSAAELDAKIKKLNPFAKKAAPKKSVGLALPKEEMTLKEYNDYLLHGNKPYYGPPVTARGKSTSKSSSSKPKNREPMRAIANLLGEYLNNDEDKKKKEEEESYDVTDLGGPKRTLKRKRDDDQDDDGNGGSGFGLRAMAKKLRSNFAY